MEWDDAQAKVLRECQAWLESRGGPQVRYLAGYAGSGKSTLARHLAEGYSVQYCAFTGKAALVLREKGCTGATTIHQLIYQPREIRVPQPDGSVKNEVRFTRRHDGPLSNGSVDVVVVDECSMVDNQLAEDLLSFGVRVLVIGDPFQLPPVGNPGRFTVTDPDWLLTGVHRQAQESGVLRLATAIRQGMLPSAGDDYGDDVVIAHRDDIDMGEVFAIVDQILVGRNVTRKHMNDAARASLGMVGKPVREWPALGDHLICLRNDHELGLVNGGQWEVLETGHSWAGPHVVIGSDCPGITGRGAVLELDLWGHWFTGEGDRLGEMQWRTRKERYEFDYGYALTVHKAQGSQWDVVGVVDEGWCFREDRAKWLYTAVTRAAKQIVVIL